MTRTEHDPGLVALLREVWRHERRVARVEWLLRRVRAERDAAVRQVSQWQQDRAEDRRLEIEERVQQTIETKRRDAA